jgi:hypothetical protein
MGAAGVMAATGVALVTSGPASAGITNWPVDGQVKAKGDPFYSGIEIFGNAEPGQVRSVFALPGETALFRIRVQNTKFQNNRIAVEIDDSGGGLIRILDGKTDVTEAVFTDNYVRKVGPRESFVLKVKVRPEGGSAGVEFHLQSRKWMSEADHVVVDARNQPPS